jgi:hypothetical protein
VQNYEGDKQTDCFKELPTRSKTVLNAESWVSPFHVGWMTRPVHVGLFIPSFKARNIEEINDTRIV